MAMAPPLWSSSLGQSCGMSGDEFSLRSLCGQRVILNLLNLSFVIAFCLLLLVRRYNISWYRGRNWVTIAVASCCSITAFAYLIASLRVVFSDGFGHWTLLTNLCRALIWICLTVSLLVEGCKPVKILACVWWIMFFFFVTLLGVESLVEKHSILVLEALQWTVNFLLFYCALRNFNQFVFQKVSNELLSEPLVAKESQKGNAQVEEPSFLSKIVFSWVNPLLSLGYSKPLVLEDIPHLAVKDQAFVGHDKFTKAWDLLQKEKKSNSSNNLVLWAIARVYKTEMVMIGAFAFLRSLASVVGPLLLYAFVNYSNRDTDNIYQGLLLVGCLVVVKIVESLSQRHFFFSARRTGMRMRSALMVAVYQKQLRLSNLGRQRHSTGEVVNYIAVDAYRMGEFPMWFHVGWTSFVQLFLAIGILFGVMGLGVLPGLVPLFICGLLNVPFAKSLQKCQFEFMVAQDKRLRSTSEILNSMKIIKLQSWEEKFKKLIESYRENEFKWLRGTQYQKVFGTALYWLCPTIVSSVILFGGALFNSAPLNAGTIFTVLATLRLMSEPVRVLPEALSVLIQVKVSFDRINSFLVEDELKCEDISKNPELHDSSSCIRIENGNFSWDPESSTPTLKDVNFKVCQGQKVAVCGPVGAGKSSFLLAILGEILKIAGNVDVFGSIAYVSQTSWIQSGTIRDNILFGKPMDRTRYETAIRVCALNKDIDGFDHGDLTEIGQRGLNMSGGQKQRIQLARAVYNDADIYLLDDPFSAVDAHTAATLFNDCVMTALKKKTVILVTHQVEFLSEVDNILVIEGGQVTQSGSYMDLLMAGTTFEELVNAHKNAMTGLEPSVGDSRKLQSGNMINSDDPSRTHLTKEHSEGEISIKSLPGVQLTEEEEKEIGNVGWKPFLDYVTVSKGFLFLFLSTMSQVGFVVLQAASSFWLAYAIQVPRITSFMLVGVYTLISTSSTFCVFLRSLFAALFGLKASKAFFSKFTNSIFSAPMLFFDSTPVGRILTRASSDLSVLDFDIPFSVAFVLAGLIEVLAIVGIMAYVTWQVLIIAIFAVVATKYVQGYYQPTAMQLMRINGTTKAPVMNFAAETSLGVATIRAFKMREMFFQNYLKLVDTDASTFIFSNATLEWLVLRTEALQNLTLFTGAFLLVLLPKDYIPPGLVGLSLSYSLSLTGTQVFMIRWYCSLCNFLISVERIKQFMHVPSEPPAVVENSRPPASWPSKGRIEFQDLKIRYRPNAPLVLKGITCTFREGTRVGIVGRTGSGKTTLITALFRLVEPDSGRILVDGVDICSIGLKDLRMKLSVIPQEPTLFRGSIRTNLDPLRLYSDDDIWNALEKCQLKSIVSTLPGLLDSAVSDDGENWSAGQRQLFCLGRVLLRRNRILVLDEATASVDSATDAILQKIIREEFSNCTVITVAHRVPTVIDSDMVMVLSFGKLIEYDVPSKLMECDSSFSKLVAEYWASCRRSSAQRLDA